MHSGNPSLLDFMGRKSNFLVLALLGRLDGAVERDLLGVELYSGMGWLTQAFQIAGEKLKDHQQEFECVEVHVKIENEEE